MKNNEGKKQNQIILSGKKMATILLMQTVLILHHNVYMQELPV